MPVHMGEEDLLRTGKLSTHQHSCGKQPSSPYFHVHRFALALPRSFSRFFGQSNTKGAHGGSIFIDIRYELIYTMHLDTREQPGAVIYPKLLCCSAKLGRRLVLFLNVFHTSPLDFTSFGFGSLSSPNTPPSLEPTESHEIKIAESRPHESNTRVHSFYPITAAVFLVHRRALLPIFVCVLCCQCPFKILPTRLFIPHENASKFFFPWFIAFILIKRHPFYQIHFAFILDIQKTCHLMGIYGDVIGPECDLRDAQEWHRVARTRSPSWTHIFCVKIRQYLC